MRVQHGFPGVRDAPRGTHADGTAAPTEPRAAAQGIGTDTALAPLLDAAGGAFLRRFAGAEEALVACCVPDRASAVAGAACATGGGAHPDRPMRRAPGHRAAVARPASDAADAPRASPIGRRLAAVLPARRRDAEPAHAPTPPPPTRRTTDHDGPAGPEEDA